MADIAIIRNAPPPPAKETRGRKTGSPKKDRPHRRYPWDQLEAGDAFDVPIPVGPPPPCDRYPEYNALTANIAARHKRNPNGPRYVARMMDDFRVRVWRVA